MAVSGAFGYQARVRSVGVGAARENGALTARREVATREEGRLIVVVGVLIVQDRLPTLRDRVAHVEFDLSHAEFDLSPTEFDLSPTEFDLSHAVFEVGTTWNRR